MMRTAFRNCRRTVLMASAATVIGGGAVAQELGEPVPPISLVYYAGNIVYEQSARVLSSEWAELGLEFELQAIQFSTFVSTINVGGQLEDMAVVVVGADPDRVDPTYWLYDSSACGQRRNAAKGCDEEYSELADDQRGEVNPERRVEMVHQLQQMHHDAAPWWPVVNSVYGMVWNAERWENMKSPSPVSPHEGPLAPWLSATPLGDDRILDWGGAEDVSTYNPMAEEGGVGWMRFVFDTFAKTDSGGEIIPWAAESWEFTDDTTLRVNLREGMTFHDGEAVTAADAVYTLNMLAETQPPAMAARISNIDSAAEVDDLTFDITLKSPDATFVPNSLTFLFILPEHLWADYEGDKVDRDLIADNAVIGSGPFKFVTWRVNELHEFETHKEHFAAPDYDGFRRVILGSADAIRAALSGGSVDIATGTMPVAAMSDLAAMEDHLDFMEFPTHASQLVWVNNEKAPFSDRAFRHALRAATNNERVVMEAYQGFSDEAAAGPIPQVLTTWYDTTLEPVSFDIEAARAILEEAGYGWDDQGRLHYPPNQ